MNTKHTILLTIAIASLGLAGCDVGNAPAGQSAEEARAEFQSKPPEEQIKLIQSSPAPPAEKEARIAEIRKKHNLSDTGAAPAGGPQPGGSFPGDPRGAGR
ncbi:hypothetical protein EON82_01705 [bacterium]|nr:MAG: hypothetical protein EON82_01705 [bacterium]